MPKKSSKPKARAVPKAKGKTAAISDVQVTNTGRPGDEPTKPREGYEVIDEKAGNYWYNTKTGQPEPISKPSAPFPTDADEHRMNTGRTRDEKTNDGTDGTDGGMAGDTTQLADSERSGNVGKVAILEDSPVSENLDNPLEILLSSRAERLPGESRNGCWERLRKMARAAGMPRGQGPGTAYYWADEQIARIFAKPIEPEPEPVADPPEPAAEPVSAASAPEQPSIAVAAAPVADDGSVSGLSELPPGWPELPANAQLQVEIAWVTANRLRVRCGTGVDLSKALSPAPSYSALSWLETSILFPAKFADISVKATADNDSEKEFIKREKMAIEEIRSILKEMMEDEDG